MRALSVITVARRMTVKYWEPSVVIDPSAFGWKTTVPVALMEASVNPLMRRLRPQTLLQRGACLTQARINVSCVENMLIQKLDVWHLDRSVVRGRCATSSPWRMVPRHVDRAIQQQRRAHVCQAQILTDVSPPVLHIAMRRRTALPWDPKVVAMLHASGMRVIADLLQQPSCSWCDLQSSFLLVSGRD